MDPTVRLAYNPPHSEALKLAPTVRLAYCGSGRETFAMPDNGRPALLVSYVYIKPFLKNRHTYQYRDWVMDSGAFSAHNSGITIELQAYIDTCAMLLKDDPTLTEVFALDVIGDWQASLANTEAMWKAGVPAIPCYHFGDPEEALLAMARDYPKIAVGGVVGVNIKTKVRWCEQIFARVWPKKIHGFGIGSPQAILQVPFHSVDATNWEMGPCAFGRWASFGDLQVRGSKQNLRAEVEFYLDLEARARIRWKAQMAELDALNAPTLRLALANGQAERNSKGGLT